jgi:hypothetical protein
VLSQRRVLLSVRSASPASWPVVPIYALLTVNPSMANSANFPAYLFMPRLSSSAATSAIDMAPMSLPLALFFGASSAAFGSGFFSFFSFVGALAALAFLGAGAGAGKGSLRAQSVPFRGLWRGGVQCIGLVVSLIDEDAGSADDLCGWRMVVLPDAAYSGPYENVCGLVCLARAHGWSSGAVRCIFSRRFLTQLLLRKPLWQP